MKEFMKVVFWAFVDVLCQLYIDISGLFKRKKPSKKKIPIRAIESPETDEFYNFSINQKV